MARKLLLRSLIALPFILSPAITAGQDSKSARAVESTKLAKDEITMLMIQVGRMPVKQQDRKMEMIWDHLDGNETPKSDFLFCSGFAYLGNYKAQACLGNAFEKGRGVEKDLTDAYVWYAIAFDNPIEDPEIRQQIRANRDRLKKTLLTGTPARSGKELEDLVKLQKATRTLYLAEIQNIRF